MKTEQIMLTPELAEQYLKTMVRNRPVSKTKVKKFTEDISSGNWGMTHQSLAFTESGQLCDGQHRCLAVIESGAPIFVSVTYGVPEANWKYMDRNQGSRTANDRFKTLNPNVKHATIIVAVSKRLMAWESCADKAKFGVNLTVSVRDEDNYANDHTDEILEAIDSIKSSAPYRNCKAASSLVTALVILKRAGASKYDDFVYKLRTGLDLYEDSPIYHLRERLCFPQGRARGQNWETNIMALTIKAWNFYVEGKKHCKMLRYTQEGKTAHNFPTPMEVSNEAH